MLVEPRELLRTAISRSPGFQSLVGAVGYPDKAIKRVHIDSVSPDPKDGNNYSLEELEVIRPYALVYYGDGGFQWVRDAMGEGEGGCVGQVGGDIMCEIYRNTPSGDSQEVAIDFMVMLNSIASYVISNSEIAGNLFIHQFTFNGPYRTSEEEYAMLGDSQGALMTFGFGNIGSV